MAHYVVLSQFTDQGIRAIKDTGKRAKALRAAAAQMGVTVKDIFWTLGRYDAVWTFDAPSDEIAASFLMKIASLGNLKSQTLRAFSESEIDALTAKV